MKKELLPSIILTVLCILLFSVAYPCLVWGIAQLAPDKGNGKMTTSTKGSYYANIAQNFTSDSYFWSRPSAVNYNAAGSGGSNKGTTNPEYLKQVQDRIDSFIIHHPGVKKSAVPAELVTASGSGLDPDISPEAALVQAARVAAHRGIS